MKAMSGFYYVERGGQVTTCRARGKFRYQKLVPLVGDRVEFLLQPDGSGYLDKILPRKNEFQRPAVANIDQMVIIASGALPTTDPFLIDRITAIVESRNCKGIICINKWDLAEAQELYSIYQNAGFQTICTSAKTGLGIEQLRECLAGKVSAFTGNSGVGKSSLLNALDPDYRIRVGEVSEKLGRGRHTTRHIEIFSLSNGGLIADTPGYSAFDAEKMELPEFQKLQDSFHDFAPFIGHCQFLDCAHVKEKGCAVLAAVKNGGIEPTRHESYVRLYQQSKERKNWK